MDLKDILLGLALGTAATVGYNNLDDETKDKISKALGNIGDDTKSKIKEISGIDLDEQVKSAKGSIDQTLEKYNIDDVLNNAKETVSKASSAVTTKASETLDKLAADKTE
jgi:ribosomal protein L12E/L44/L45/RPP1/RPP2